MSDISAPKPSTAPPGTAPVNGYRDEVLSKNIAELTQERALPMAPAPSPFRGTKKF